MSNKTINDFVINVATVNGSGSQSANLVLIRSLFKMGIPVGGKNLFPSNIAGLPTWFIIRANKHGYMGSRIEADVVVGMNASTIVEDLKKVKSGGYFIYNDEIKVDPILLPKDVHIHPVPFRQLVAPVTDSIKLKKLLTNMIYVGILAELMHIDQEAIEAAIESQFEGKASARDLNLKAVAAGRDYVKSQPQFSMHHQAQKMQGNEGKILIEGNMAAALGMVFGGCNFVAWYPITPSSSVVENFMHYAEKYRKDKNGKNTFAVVQAEDELASICMVAGAGWAGARAMTATSGPGLSLMAEAIGYSYYAEVPTVIWDIQRVGPSTGLPTRTMQGDIAFAANISHGDTQHPMLLPGNPTECFDFAIVAFDLAERLQTFVAVMSDLDVGMNYWVTDKITYPEKPFDRGKVLNKEALEKVNEFARYKDVDQDGIPYRTLPGTDHKLAPYFTRGSGHNEQAQYTESHEAYVRVMDRLKLKLETAKKYLPQPVTDIHAGAEIGLIAYGSTDAIATELRDTLAARKVNTSYLRLRSFPFTDEVESFIAQHKRVYIIEQNRDAQMAGLLQNAFPQHWEKYKSVLHYNGLPIDAVTTANAIFQKEGLI